MCAKGALLVIDMQNDFCLPGAVLCVQGAMQCLPQVIKAVELARQHKVPVIWVVREHHPSGGLACGPALESPRRGLSLLPTCPHTTHCRRRRREVQGAYLQARPHGGKREGHPRWALC